MYNRQSDHYNDPINQNIDFFGHAGIFIKHHIREQTLEAIAQRQPSIMLTPPNPLFSKEGEKKLAPRLNQRKKLHSPPLSLRGGRVGLRILVSGPFDVWTILRPFI